VFGNAYFSLDDRLCHGCRGRGRVRPGGHGGHHPEHPEPRLADGRAGPSGQRLLPNLAIDTFNSGVIAGGSVTLTESNAAAAAFSSGYFQARALSGTVVNLSAFSSGGIRFSYNAAWAAASPTLKVSVRVNDGVSTTYSAFVAT
jgi:hypothetical protein